MPARPLSSFTVKEWVQTAGAIAVLVAIGVTVWDVVGHRNAPAPVSPAVAFMPLDEARFVAAVATAQSAFRAAANDMAAGGVRADRRKAICAALADKTVKDWAGTIKTLDRNGDGHGVLAVALGKGITLATWNNDLSDIGSHTLLAPRSDVFNAAAATSVGDVVVFSGDLFSSNDDCVKETSLSLDGGMKEPEFLFRFRSLRKL